MIYVICGPTASGKTEVASKVAKILNCPIVNADAFQIYKDMNIGTAKIDENEDGYNRYCLLDICSPSETYSVKEYQDDFRKTVKEVFKTSKDVVVCGGTGLYIKAALFDYIFEESKEVDLSEYDSLTNEELFEKLKELDFNATLNLHPNNRKRVMRALAIAKSSSSVKSEIIANQSHSLIFDAMFLMLNPERESLYAKINCRVDQMFENGLIDEVKTLLSKYELSITSKQAIGYKEVIEYLDGQITLEECKELIKKRTRNYAKRQVTFFKHQLPCISFETKDDLMEYFNEHRF